MHLTDSGFDAKMQELFFEYVKADFFSVSWQNYWNFRFVWSGRKLSLIGYISKAFFN